MTTEARAQLIDMKRQLTPDDILEAELKATFTKRPAEVKKFKRRQARLKGMETQWEPYRIQIERYVDKKINDSKNLPEKIERLQSVLQKECAHPVETLDVTSDYIHSTADPIGTKPRTEYVIRCSLCGQKKLAKTVVHDSYGD